jgi:hypothetical protein
VRQNCNSGFWRSGWNGLWLANSIVMGWGQGDDYCSVPVGGYHILSTSISGSNMQEVVLTSPIISQTCAETIIQTDGVSSDNTKVVSC